MTALPANLRNVWRHLSRIDLFAIGLILGGATCAFLDLSGGLASFLKFFAIIATVYALFRLAGWWRTRLLWSLRNRLIVAYLFIAVVPILLIVTLVVLAGQMLYSQLGAYLLYDDIHQRIAMMSDVTDHIAAAHGTLQRGISEEESERVLAAQSHEVHDQELPGLSIEFSNDPSLLRKVAGAGKTSFAGLVEESDTLYLMSIREMPEPTWRPCSDSAGSCFSRISSYDCAGSGAIQLNLTRRFEGGTRQGILYTSGEVAIRNDRDGFRRETGRSTRHRIGSIRRSLGSPALTRFMSAQEECSIRGGRCWSRFNARPSRLNGRIFASLGELSDFYAIGFIVVSDYFLLIEIAALITGVVMTRRITKAVSDLYQATQYVKAGDWTHRVRIERRDQLGVLGESFNDMTGSISGLLEESKKRQRLENELSIASEVQNQLFPQKVPSVAGVELEAIYKAARTVSGDYYDFIQLSPTHLAIALADISGKGISAALLMASLQAALRSQLLAAGSEKMSTAELVGRFEHAHGAKYCRRPVRYFFYRRVRQRDSDASLYQCGASAGIPDCQWRLRSTWTKAEWYSE